MDSRSQGVAEKIPQSHGALPDAAFSGAIDLFQCFLEKWSKKMENP